MRLALVDGGQEGKRLGDVGLHSGCVAEGVVRRAVQVDEHGELVEVGDGVGVGVWRGQGDGADAPVEDLEVGVVGG